MSFSLTGPIRGLFLFGIALSATAVALGRLAPQPTNCRILLKSSSVGINGYHFTKGDHSGLFLDPDTGEYSKMELPDGDTLDHAIFSPWQDGSGARQVVGRWVSRSLSAGLSEGFGLARYSYPDGKVLDRIPLEVMPMGIPCFFPGRSARILFAGGDGRLYRIAFEDEHGLPYLGDADVAQPTPLVWRSDVAGAPPAAIADPMWPRDPRLAGTLLVSLTRLHDLGGGKSIRHASLWWIRLDAEATQIIGAGPLHSWDRSFGSDVASWPEESLPNLRESPEGDLVLAYLMRRDREPGWELRLAPIDIDKKTGNPVMRVDQGLKLAGARLHSLPVFSGDGRWVYSLPRLVEVAERPERVPVPTIVRNSDPTRRHLASRTPREAWD